MKLHLITATLAAAAIALTLAPPASALELTMEEGVVSSTRSTASTGVVTTTHVTRLEPGSCAEYRRHVDKESTCEFETLSVVGPEENASEEEVATLGTASALESTSVEALAAYSPRCRNWEMLRRPRDGSMLWQISQRGRHCWDGEVAWFGSYRNVSGYHQCGHADYGIFSIRSKSCLPKSGNKTSTIRNGYSVTFEIPKTTLYSTFSLLYTGTRSGAYTMSGL